MEAATAGQGPAAADTGLAQGEQPAEQTEGNEAGIAEWQQSVDHQLSSANDAVRQLVEANQTFQQSVMERLPEPAAPPSFEDQFQELFGDAAQTGYIEPGQIQGLQSLVQQQIQQGIKDGVAPLMEEIGEFRQSMTSQQLQGLQTRFPELQDQKAADSLAGHVVDTALSVVPRGAPPQVAEALMNNADFVALVHLAEKAKGVAREETPAGQGQNVPQIETDGSSAPGSTAGGDEWDQFVQQRRPMGSVWD